MKKIPVLISLLLLLLHLVKSDENPVRDTLLQFLSKLSNNKTISAPGSGWNISSDPCSDRWRGVACDHFMRVRKIDLGGLDLEGVFDPSTLCALQSIVVINITRNNIRGENLEAIDNCFELTHLDISSNQFSGELQDSFAHLSNLEALDVSNNNISGSLPDLSRMHGLTVFLGQENSFSGDIPVLDYSRFVEFNLSNNNLSGPIPVGAHGLPPSSFLNNPELCGPPSSKNCSSASAEESSPNMMPPPNSMPQEGKKHGLTNNQILMYMGYVLIAFVVLFLVLVWLRKKGRREGEQDNNNVAAGVAAPMDDSMIKPSFSTVELKASKGDHVDYSTEVSTSLIVLTSPEVNGMRFEDLLKAPAELIGRGNHGSVYKVVCEDHRMVLAVKRIKDWPISSGEFRQRMRRLSQVKHGSVMPAVAYYSSGQEKLIVYDYQKNGSLFRHIHAHGNEERHPMEWSSRLRVAATVADALAYMHDELQYDRVPHGNLKSSNILFNENMEASISEYGLMLVADEEHKGGILALQAAEDYKAIFKVDTYGFGVILLELLTGRTPLNEGLDLATWVVAVVREEWTVEVFDKNLIREGINEERMLNLLQMAIKCVANPVEARPSMRQVALALGAIREEDERSLDMSGLSAITRSFVAP